MRKRHHATLARKRRRDKARKERRKLMERERARRNAAIPDSDSLGKRMCGEKMRYASKGEALSAASYVLRRKAVALRTYKCPMCGGWHLTKMRASD